jgi:hypothetical protein
MLMRMLRNSWYYESRKDGHQHHGKGNQGKSFQDTWDLRWKSFE